MRTIPAGLVPIVEASLNAPVELYELYLDTGTRYFAMSDVDVIFAGIQYKALGIAREAIETHLSNESDAVTVGLTDVKRELSQLLARTDFKGRRARLIRVFRESLTDPTHYIHLFEGLMDQPAISITGKFSVRILSYLDLLHRDYPGRVFSTQCNHKLYDDWCQADPEDPDNKVTGLVDTNTTTQVIIASELTQADDYWKIGRLRFTAGVNLGLWREVITSDQSDTSLTLRVPLPNTPAVGDAFEVIRGCNKTRADCIDKFDNFVNYGGFPYIPSPSVAVAALNFGGGGKGGGKGGGGK